MGLFKGIKDAYGTEGGNYFKPGGNYLVEIQKCKEGKTRNGADFFVAECKTIESDNEAQPPGSINSFYVGFDKYPDLALGDVANFMRAGLVSLIIQNKIEDEEIPADHTKYELEEEVAEQIAGEENILVGTLVNCYAFNKPTKTGNDFTRHTWSPVTEEQCKKHRW